MSRRTSLGIALALAVASTGCGGAAAQSAFSTEWQNDGGVSIKALQARLGNSKVPASPGLVVGVTPAGLVASSLDGKTKWTHAMKLDARPSIAGNVVVATGGGNLVALDAASGKPLWSMPSDGKSLRGAGDDGSITVATLANRNGGGSRFIAVNRQGSVVRKIDPDQDVGIPAVVDGVAFVPWGNQYVSAIEVSSGKEIARLLTRTQVTRADAIGGDLYFGDSAVLKFDEKIAQAATTGATTIQLPDRNLPGRPRWFETGTIVEPPTSSARDRIRLYARPSADNRTGVDTERFLATYFRIAVGMHASEGVVRWVRVLPDDVIGGDATPRGFAVCDEKGNVHLFGAARGSDSGTVSLGTPLTACVVDGGTFQMPDGKDDASPVEQMSKAVLLRKADLVTIQRFLLRDLAAKPEPEVTKALIDLTTDPNAPPTLIDDARQMLATRRSGADYMLETLEQKFDFLSGVLRPPPVGPLADALAAMGDKRAAPVLAMHLNDPANETDDIRRAAQALTKLATEEQADDLRTFFSLYRATADDENMVAAVLAVADALMRVGGDAGQDLVRHATIDPLTHPAVKEGLKGMVKSEKG